MNSLLAWDDLQLVLAIAASGTLSGAGRRLGVSHATVFRRLGAIESRIGVKLFERSRTGYAPTLAGEEVAAAAQRIETQVLEVERRIAGRDLRPSGTVRVTTIDSLLAGIVSPILADFSAAHPDISLEIAVSNRLFSLSRREADVAIRPSPSLQAPEKLVERKVGTIAQAVYGRRELFPEDQRAFDRRAADWVGPDEGMTYRDLEAWMADQDLDTRCRYRIDSVFGMYLAVANGQGLAVLPCYLGETDRRLKRFGKPIPALATDLWILTHPDLRKTARVRALVEFFTEAVNLQRARLVGRV